MATHTGAAKGAAGKRTAAKPAVGGKGGKPPNGSLEEREKAVRELICRSCLALDELDFNAYLDLCHPDYRYVISAYSPELRKGIVWLNHDKRGMKSLFGVLPRHVSDNLIRLALSRHVTVYTIDYSRDQTRATTVSALQVFTTTKDGGITQLFGVAKYYDTVALDGGKPLLLRREVRLDTRMLGETGAHIPF